MPLLLRTLRTALPTLLMLVTWGGASTAIADELPIPEGARGAGAEDGGDPRVEATLVLDQVQVVPGSRVRVGVRLAMDEHWHVYWRNPGEAAYATEVNVEAAGLEIGPLQWPWPQVFTSGGGVIVTYGYEDEVVLFRDADVRADAEGVIRIDAVADFLVCRVDCIPGRIELSRELVVGAAAVPSSARERAWLDAAAARVPQGPAATVYEVEGAVSVTAVRPGDRFEVAWGVVHCHTPTDRPDCHVPTPPEDDALHVWVPDISEGVTWSAPQVAPHPTASHGIVVRVPGRASIDAYDGPDQTSGGVLRVVPPTGDAVAMEVAVTFERRPVDATVDPVAHVLFGPRDDDASGATPPRSSGEDAPGATSSEGRSVDSEVSAPPLALVLLFAFLGGMVLNLMPCVLPVLAMKAVGFATIVREGRGRVAAHALAYVGGILGTMALLAGVVLALRLSGNAVGWGFQFQHPIYLVAVAALVTAFAMNLFGAWEIALDASGLDEATRASGGLRRSVLEGVLTVILATPCSAPLLGTAVGFALAAPPWVVVPVFLSVGLGLATPFVVVTLVPGAERLLPRPGAWMSALKTGLGYCLLLAALWMVWLVGGTWGSDAATRLVLFLMVLSASLHAWGAVQFRGTAWARGGLAAALGVIGLAGWGLVGDLDADIEVASADGGPRGAVWSPWSAAAVNEGLAAGRVVFVDFTADWCITCKVNERQVIETPEMLAWMAEHEIVLLKGDWTRRDDAIRDELARWGKAGVPLYLVHAPGDATPRVLPELLTAGMLRGALTDALATTERR